jgi:hypothetical protein
MFKERTPGYHGTSDPHNETNYQTAAPHRMLQQKNSPDPLQQSKERKKKPHPTTTS